MKLFLSLLASCLVQVTLAARADQITSKIDLAFTGCPAVSANPGAFVYAKDCITKVYDNHPFTKTTFQPWMDSIQKDVGDRLLTVNQEMIQYMTLDGLLWGFPYENIQAASDPELLANAVKALQSIPQEMRPYIKDRFYGFMVLSGTGWTGFATEIFEVPGNPLKKGSAIIINADNMKGRTLNDWLDFKEATAHSFLKADSKFPKFKMKIQYSKAGDSSTRTDLLKFFLTHEVSHLIATAVPSIHPTFNNRGKPIPVSEFTTVWADGSRGFPFLKTTWTHVLAPSEPGVAPSYQLSRMIPDNLNAIFANKKVKYYGDDESKKFNANEAIAIYNGLNGTCFPTLYSTVDYTEDFAESVASFFLSRREGYQFKVMLTRQGAAGKAWQTVANFDSDIWSNPKCAYKIQYFNSLFGSK